ncbi:MAG TPA: BlaI/MecI/CopY family transcriptional regulator [Dysgonomonas sp.]|uniref:BlaI/MecI/CopY family transcriptional regulator n=1 Tax=unclassified Dysgonomonas TaxID=2630389 RepID=UPI0025C59579|nr:MULTISPECIES: BlaI/MecI/CopY family transcriptional regulator [unclassified Dysgonomonas]HML65501.1 BlaI/MecI/CopY family transcriptional regulator [Dysgonomonas sp.]
MKNLTKKEEEIMDILWSQGPMRVKDIQDLYDDPKPHVNTISTLIRILEDKGYVGYEPTGKAYRYYALVSKDSFKKNTLTKIISEYFNNSYLGAVSSLVEEEKISVEDLKGLIEKVEKAAKNKK